MTEPPRYKLLVCVNNIARPDKGCCGQRGSVALAKTIAREVAARGVNAAVEEIVCLGNCHRGPSMRIAPGGRFFFRVNSDQLPAIVDALEQVAGVRETTGAEDDPEHIFGGVAYDETGDAGACHLQD